MAAAVADARAGRGRRSPLFEYFKAIDRGRRRRRNNPNYDVIYVGWPRSERVDTRVDTRVDNPPDGTLRRTRDKNDARVSPTPYFP